MARLGAESLAAHMLADPVLVRRYGFAVVHRGAMRCYSSTKLDAGVFNHVSGYGTFASASQRTIDAVLRYYDGIGGAVHFEVMVPAVSRADRALLVRNGFRDRSVIFQCHVRTSSRPPSAHAVPGLTIARVRRADAEGYGKVASRGFGDRGWSKIVFSRFTRRRVHREHRRRARRDRRHDHPAADRRSVLRKRGPCVPGSRDPERDDRRAYCPWLGAGRSHVLFLDRARQLLGAQLAR
jgi:hypothetical protein